MRPLILFAPGAGAPSTSAWMTAWAARLAALGDVSTFDYPYQVAGRKFPDKLDKLIAAHQAALTTARGGHERVVLAGKSMGSRIGCHLSLVEPVQALVCFGYPLVSPAGTVRDEVLLALATPILFVQGTRDPLCPLERLADVRAAMKARSELFVVEGGDHSLDVPAAERRAKSQDQHEQDVLAAVTRFLTPPPPPEGP